MKKIFLLPIFLSAILLFSGCGAGSGTPAVKKSDTGICHKEGTNYYKNTKNFTPYNSVEDCLNSGGRLPKK